MNRRKIAFSPRNSLTLCNSGSRPSDYGGGGGGDGSQPDPEIRGARSPKTIFSALWASVWSKNKG